MKFKILVTFLVFIFLYLSVIGQVQTRYPVSMPSANASNLILYSETPVSKFTGIPYINLPIYKIIDGNLSIPLNLNYHSAGIQPDVHPGWVGSGWSLQSGGVITRKVNGIPDEYPNDIGGYYDQHSILSASDWTSTANLQNYANSGSDVAPDEFSFSVGEISGKFIMDHLGNWQVKCDQDVKVVFNAGSDFVSPFMATPPPNPYGWTSYYRCFGKFTLITPDGTSYVFGGNANAIDYSTDFFNQNSSHWTATSWYLTQIISVDGLHNINLTYERDNYTNVLYRTFYKNILNISTGSGPVTCHTDVQSPKTTALLGGNLLSPVYLKSIETSKYLVTFNRSTSIELGYEQSIYSSSYQSYSNRLNPTGNVQEIIQSISERLGDTATYKFLPLLRINGLSSYPAVLSNLKWKKLDNISIKDKGNSQIFKQYTFNYSNNGSQRLTLKSFKESNPSGNVTDTIAPYRFYYDVSQPLPASYLSEVTDDWGYATAPTGVPLDENNIFSSRPANPVYTGIGTLRKMIFPTGGYKLFFFESNDYSSVVNPGHTTISATKNTLGGGIRIKAVFDYDPVAKSLKSKKYFYVKSFLSPNQVNSVSSGIISGLPQRRWQNSHVLTSGETLSSDLSSRNTLLPLSENADGSQVGYSEVSEVLEDNSFTISKYTNFDDGHLDETFISSLFPEKEILNNFTSSALERGSLKYSADYNSAGKRLRSSTITYAPVHNLKNYVKATDVRRYQVCDFGNPNNGLSGPYVYEGGAYKIYTYSYLPVSVVDSVLDSSTPMVSVSNIFYDNSLNKLSTRVEKIRTDGKKQTVLTSYPQDYAAGTGFIDNMIAKNILDLPIEKVNYLTNLSTGNVNVISGSLTVYKPLSPFLKDTVSMLETASPLSLANFKFSGSIKGALPYNTAKLMFSKDPSYNAKLNYTYNNYFNLIQVNQNNGISSSIVWGYNNSLPVAQVVNAKINEIYFNGFEEDLSGTSTDGETGLKSKLLAGGTFTIPTMPTLASGQNYLLTYWFKNTGGNWIFFSNVYANLPTGITGYNLIDEVRIYSQNARMVTTAYLSARGQPTSTTDESARTLHYIYDGLQRLKQVKNNNLDIIKDYTYSYAPAQTTPDVFYYNVPKSGSFQRNDCSGGKTGTVVTYAVTAGSYVSNVSQAKADSLAQNDLAINGSTFANFTGKCVYLNAAQTHTYYKSDCVSPQVGNAYVVTIPQGYFSSEVSQADADAQATSETASRAAYANSSGSCHVPAAMISVTDGYSAGTIHKELGITLTNVNTHATYNSGTVSPGGYTTFTAPPGTYSIIYTVGSPLNSLQLLYNNGLIACKGNAGSTGTFINITLVDQDSVSFLGGAIDCPSLP